MALRPQDRERGLAAFNEARHVRRRAIVYGRVRVREVATRFWLLTFVGLGIFAVVYYRYAQIELAAQRHEVLLKQRAVAAALGQEGLQMRDKLESWVRELAEGESVQRIVPTASLDAIARGPVIYVRMLLSEARDSKALHRSVNQSLRDGFTSCLFMGRGGDPTQGTQCKTTSQCGPGELCNDWNVCASPSHPYNLKLLYDATRLLLPEWKANLEGADTDMKVRAVELDLEDAAKHEVPAAITMLRAAKYFTVVLDEPPSEAAMALDSAAELRETPQQQVQASDHYVRVGIWDITQGEQLAELRLQAAGRYVPVGQHRPRDPRVERAQRRQANNCAVATQVRRTLETGRVDSGNDPLPGTEELTRELTAGE